jgi:WD40 repeat protein
MFEETSVLVPSYEKTHDLSLVCKSLVDPSSGETPTTNLTPLAELQGHTGRVCRTEFHPSGKYLASASFDGTWRLWDVERGVSLLEQEGHSKEVYAVNFQGDGALLCSGFVFLSLDLYLARD